MVAEVSRIISSVAWTLQAHTWCWFYCMRLILFLETRILPIVSTMWALAWVFYTLILFLHNIYSKFCFVLFFFAFLHSILANRIAKAISRLKYLKYWRSSRIIRWWHQQPEKEGKKGVSSGRGSKKELVVYF